MGTVAAWIRGLGLLPRFSALSLLAFLAIGLVGARVLHDQIRDRALDDAAASAALVARFGIQPQLSASDLERGLAPEAVASVDRLLAAGYTGGSVTGLTVFARGGRVVYSTHHRLIGRQWSVSPRVARSLLTRTTAQVAPGEREIVGHVPLRLARDGRADGAFEVRLPYAPVATAIRHDTRRLYACLGAGLLLLWLALSRIAAGASRALRRQAAHSAHLAHHDGLTGLPNRTLFYRRVAGALEAAGAAERRAAVMILDLDRFKEVNDTLGHHSGDTLLRRTGERVAAVLRADDVFARLGGDEFAVLLPSVADADAAVTIAARIREALEDPFDLDGLPIPIEASVGIAVFPDHGADVDELMQRADVAMYQAKAASSDCTVYCPAADPYSPARLAMVGQLRAAIDGGQLELHYQPKADLTTGEVRSVEALVRWRHAELGLLAPGDFVPLAEHTGLIRPMTLRVVEDALAQCAAWVADGLDLAVAVNLSARNLADPELPDLIAERLRTAGVAPARLTLEITESSLMADRVRARQVLDRLAEMGVGLSIDDFGTGYSSLAYLSELPVSELKIDRGFVARMSDGGGDAFIVRATIDLGRNLGLSVVAEGVETEAEWRMLAGLGCHVAQGYFLGKPMPGGEVAQWLAAAGPRWAAQRVARDIQRRESA